MSNEVMHYMKGVGTACGLNGPEPARTRFLSLVTCDKCRQQIIDSIGKDAKKQKPGKGSKNAKNDRC